MDLPQPIMLLLGLCLIGIPLVTFVGGVIAAASGEDILFGCMQGFMVSLCVSLLIGMATLGVFLVVVT
jgi:hypothetical protein